MSPLLFLQTLGLIKRLMKEEHMPLLLGAGLFTGWRYHVPHVKHTAGWCQQRPGGIMSVRSPKTSPHGSWLVPDAGKQRPWLTGTLGAAIVGADPPGPLSWRLCGGCKRFSQREIPRWHPEPFGGHFSQSQTAAAGGGDTDTSRTSVVEQSPTIPLAMSDTKGENVRRYLSRRSHVRVRNAHNQSDSSLLSFLLKC